MYLSLYFLLSCLFFVLSPAIGYSQTFSYGLKAGYVTYNRYYVEQTIEGTDIMGMQGRPNSFMDGFRFAGLVRANHKKWSGQAELAYAYHLGNGSIVIDNWNNPANTNASDQWLVSSITLLQQAEINLNAGYQPVKWLRLSAGLGLWYVQPRNREELNIIPDDQGVEEITRALNTMNRFAYGIQESYLPWVLTRQVGVAIEPIKNLSLEVVYDRSITPVSKTLTYKDQVYSFRQRTDRFVVSVSYRLFHPNNNPSSK